MAKDEIVKKPVWQSKILWWNVFLLLLAVVDALKQVEWIRGDVLLFAGLIVTAVLRIWFSGAKLTPK